jgi:ubiquinone biosynthesis protein
MSIRQQGTSAPPGTRLASKRRLMWPLKAVVFVGRVIRLAALSIAFGPVFAVLARSEHGPRLLRWYLEACGGAMVKFGQILAMRYDLLPPAYCEALATMLDSLAPFEARKARQIVEEDLGRSIDECFSEFEEVPIGSASMAQVHRARLIGGDRVVVKILRPGIDLRMAADLRLLRGLAAVIDGLSLGGALRARDLVHEFERLTLEELDLVVEARSADQLHQLLEKDDIDHYAPRIYFAFTSRRVLTMELLEGVWMKELLDAVRTGDRQQLDDLAAKGITPRRTARLLFRSFLEQAYRHRVFHADPHPGNLILLKGGTLGYVDFGMVGWVEGRTWRHQYRLFEAISRSDIQAAHDAMVATVVQFPDSRPNDFEEQFKSLLRGWIMTTARAENDIAAKSSGRFLMSATLVIRRARMGLPMDTMRLHRAALVSDMVQLLLDPALDARREMEIFFRGELERRVRERLCRSIDIEEELFQWFTLLDGLRASAPGLIEWANNPRPSDRGTSEQLSPLEEVLGICVRQLRATLLLSNVATVALWRFGQSLDDTSSGVLVRAKAVAIALDGWGILLWAVVTVLSVWALGPIARRLAPRDVMRYSN